MGTKLHLGYSLNNVKSITGDPGSATLVWGSEGGSLVSSKEFLDSFDYILKESRKNDEFHHWLDWRY